MKNLLTHTILDSASVTYDNIQLLTEMNKTGTSLYRGRSEEQLAEVAPFLFEISDNPEFLDYVQTNSAGKAWGFYMISAASFDDIFKHFRKFLIVKTDEGKELYFRFYDPRVLRIFLPSCDSAQLKEFFGPVTQFFMEDEEPHYGIRFWLENAQLKSERFDMATWSKSKMQIPVVQTSTAEVENPSKYSGLNPWI